MKKYIKYASLIFVGILLVSPVAYAEENEIEDKPQIQPINAPVPAGADLKQPPLGAIRNQIKENREDLKEKRVEVKDKIKEDKDVKKEELKQNREEFRNKIEEEREIKKDEFEKNREEFKNLSEADREAKKDEFEAKREELKKLNEADREAKKNEFELKKEEFKKEMELNKEEQKAKMEANKEKFKADIAKIKDEKKQVTVEKIVAKIAELNTKAVNNLNEITDKIEESLLRIEARANDADTRGIDVASTRTLIEKAKSSITEVKALILAQSGKVYTANITTEAELKAAMSGIKESLNTDIKALRDQVKVVHENVKSAATTLAQTPKIDDDEEDTETTAVTPVTPTN
ncbi:MAG: hypothetical protein WCW04_00460 [Candidatus Paceibacterota bacterium]